ncbi:MAG: phosphonate ABC transporter, permease protein PhnE [Candidatus Bipolaricaulia bacterium]
MKVEVKGKAKEEIRGRVKRRPLVLKARGLALLVDWAVWGYLAYLVFFLIDYWHSQTVPPYRGVTFPTYGWWIAAIATLGVAVLWESLGQSFGLKWFYPVSEVEVARTRPRWFKTSWGIMTVVLIVMTAYHGWLITDIDFGKFIQRAPTTAYLWKWLVTPDFTHFITPEPVLQDSIATAIVETIYMALMATLLGVVFAVPLSFLGARNIMLTGPIGWVIYTITRGFFNIVRSIEPIVWAVLFAIWVRFGPFAGMLALGAHTIAALGKLYSEQVESIDPGPLEAIAATGARRWQVILYGVIPQIIPPFLAFTIYRWDINVRMSTIIGIVGGGGIGRILFYYKNEIRWQEVGAVIVVIVTVVWIMDYVSGRIRERMA